MFHSVSIYFFSYNCCFYWIYCIWSTIAAKLYFILMVKLNILCSHRCLLCVPVLPLTYLSIYQQMYLCVHSPSSVMSRVSTVCWMGIALSCVWHTRSVGQSLFSSSCSLSQSPAPFTPISLCFVEPSASLCSTVCSSFFSSCFSFPSSLCSWRGSPAASVCDVSFQWNSSHHTFSQILVSFTNN